MDWEFHQNFSSNMCYNNQTYNRYYEGGSKSPCNHLFSLHMGAFNIQRWQCLHQVWTLSFVPCNMDSVARLVALRHWHKRQCILGTTNWAKFIEGILNCEKITWWHSSKTNELNDVQIFLLVQRYTTYIRLKPCAIWEVWAYPLRIEQTFSTPQMYRQLKGPNYWKR